MRKTTAIVVLQSYLCSPIGKGEDRDHPACEEYRKEINSDDRTDNDIPPDAEGRLCDYQQNQESCYDKITSAKEFCTKYPEYSTFCEKVDIDD